MVRLTEEEKKSLLLAWEKVSRELNLDWVKIALFGSRTDPSKKGGDIDLYVEVKPSGVDLSEIKRKWKLSLQDFLGEQKFDIIVDDGMIDLGSFGEMVRKNHVVLWTKA